MNNPSPDIALQVENLRVDFRTAEGTTQAVRGVSFSLKRGSTLAIVGESGSGKSVTSYSILRLIQKPGEIVGGKILYKPRDGQAIDILSLPANSPKLFDLRGGRLSMIFQEPMTALSPVHSIGDQITEAILLHQNVGRREANQQAEAMLARVGITEPARRLKQYAFEFSGGMRQRVVIAMALVCKPDILIADEPTTALDVTIQAQVLRLIKQLQQEMGTSVIFITHDLGVVAQIADEVVVMQLGRVVESAPARELFRNPYHPYTRRLLSSIPHAARDPRLRALLTTEPVIDGLPIDSKPAAADFAGATRLLSLPGERQLLVGI